MQGRLLLVIPPVVVFDGDKLLVDGDFANNLSAYLRNFERVTVCCPASPQFEHSGLVNPIAPETIVGQDRLEFVVLPFAYREDRYLRHRRWVRRTLLREIDRADYLLFSPHSAFDWSTMAVNLSIRRGRAYDQEADWNLEAVNDVLWRKMRPGLNKLRKLLWNKGHAFFQLRGFRRAALALLQGQDVFEAYRTVAPNPHKVLNIQVGSDAFVDEEVCALTRERGPGGAPWNICYA